MIEQARVAVSIPLRRVPHHRRSTGSTNRSRIFAARRRRTGCRHAIGATTETRRSEVISPLLSRCQVYVLKAMEEADLQLRCSNGRSQPTRPKANGVEVVETEALSASAGRAQAAQHPRHPQQRYRRKDHHHDKNVTDCLQQNIAFLSRQERRTALRRNLGFHQVGARQRPERRNLLPQDARRRRRPEFIARRLRSRCRRAIGLANPNGRCWRTPASTPYTKSACPRRAFRWPKRRSTWRRVPKAIRPIWRSTRRSEWANHDTTDRPVPLHIRNAPTKLMKPRIRRQLRYAHTISKGISPNRSSCPKDCRASLLPTGRQPEGSVNWPNGSQHYGKENTNAHSGSPVKPSSPPGPANSLRSDKTESLTNGNSRLKQNFRHEPTYITTNAVRSSPDLQSNHTPDPTLNP